MTYKVLARNSVGPSVLSNEASDTTATGGVPGKPAELTVTNDDPSTADPDPSSTTLFLAWEPPHDGTAGSYTDGTDNIIDGGSPITGYDIYMYDSATSNWVSLVKDDAGSPMPVAATPRSYNHTGLTGMTKVYYSVRARNANGPGPWSDVMPGETEPSAPGKPVLTATPEDANNIVLTWTAPDDGGTAITAYHIQVSNNGSTGWGELMDDEDSATTYTMVAKGTDDPAPALTYTHEDLDGMSLKYYRVRAANGDDGTNPGMWSDVKSARTPAGKPGKPVLTAMADGADKIKLSWPAPVTGGSAIMHYQVQVWENGAWTDLEPMLTTTSYTDMDLPGFTMRYYRVQAKNSVGYSGWSGVMSARTDAGQTGQADADSDRRRFEQNPAHLDRPGVRWRPRRYPTRNYRQLRASGVRRRHFRLDLA